MTVSHVEVIAEEPSMEAALRLLLPRLLGNTGFEVYTFQCKEDLLAKLPDRLNGYRTWLPSDWRIVVVLDRDNDDCRTLKESLEGIASDAGLVTKSNCNNHQFQVVNRLAIEELEAWYFGDWEAVRSAYPRVSPKIPLKSPYRVPDAIQGGTWEAFERVMRRAGYFRNGLRKIEAARAIAQHLNIVPDANRSRSFQVFRDTLAQFAS